MRAATSGIGPKRTFGLRRGMSAFGGKLRASRLLLTQSGHGQFRIFASKTRKCAADHIFIVKSRLSSQMLDFWLLRGGYFERA